MLRQPFCGPPRRCGSCLWEGVVLRITLEASDHGSTVGLAGRLAGEFVGEAERVCLLAGAPLLIDATNLQEADADGLALLGKILAGGGRIENLSRYLAMRVEALRERGES